MKHAMPKELEASLDDAYSHLIVLGGEDSIVRLHAFLRQQGISAARELIFVDDQERTWLLVSLHQPSASGLLLELIEQGFTGDITGIDAKRA